MNRLTLPDWADCWLVSDSEMIPASRHDSESGVSYTDENGRHIEVAGHIEFDPDDSSGAVWIMALMLMFAVLLGMIIYFGAPK